MLDFPDLINLMSCVADMICDSVNSFNGCPFLPRYLIILMTRKMGSLILEFVRPLGVFHPHAPMDDKIDFKC